MLELPPEVEEKLARAKSQEGHYRQVFATMTDASLVASAKFWMQHSSMPRRFAPDEPVYDATLWHVIVPELLRRVEQCSSSSDSTHSRSGPDTHPAG